MHILTIVGARPQFIKAAPVSRALRAAGLRETLVHTGQHYDANMSQIFFEELGIPEPDLNLGVGSGSHGRQTGEMLIRLEEVMLAQRPDWVLVYGDTNSTLAAALAAVKLHIPVAHVEAGLRSFNRRMPEEHNRVLTDHCADLLFCPTQTAVNHLHREGVRKGVWLVGDVMVDAIHLFSDRARRRSHILQRLGLEPKGYLLATVHRPANTDHPERLRAILDAFAAAEEPVIFPVHPRTRKRLAELGWSESTFSARGVRMIEPVGYLDMLILEQHARLILTDSGGIQKEAYIFQVPCITLRDETEWVETVEAGWNVMVGADGEAIRRWIRDFAPLGPPPPIFGDGQAAQKIARRLQNGG
ncbi:MAG TPA: UDP-N-acetylglucosamine 2-epimerase (non-hydrolyzing) [Caldilineae bacterium]|nr:UDP-N-acetylglucosamine 2-epimerase (non-hydrolyzing) [Caldilineae bacterium]HIQ11657.1 UDP-N-acetylglucosamine 2-epimerase (non-hydrolyzing) [Caldilineales bacterium]